MHEDMHEVNPKLSDLRCAIGRTTVDLLTTLTLNTIHLCLSETGYQIKLVVILTLPMFLRLDLKIFSEMFKT